MILLSRKGSISEAWNDQPLKEGNIHISAPHIYSSILEALELTPNSLTSFLNIGSGTGYLSCLVANILGRKSLNFGVEIHDEVVEHCHSSIKNWKKHKQDLASNKNKTCSSTALLSENNSIPHIEIFHGNGLQMEGHSGEALVGFDRIYAGAAVESKDISKIKNLLSPGGILVAPVDDELVKIVRLGSISRDKLNKKPDRNEFTQQTISGVRFAPFLQHPMIRTLIPSRVWNPVSHSLYPDSFQQATMTLLLCSNSEAYQPPRPTIPENYYNLAATLPKEVWMIILSFTNRKWFQSEVSEVQLLKKRLMEEQSLTEKAQNACLKAEERANIVEGEKDVYHLLARRWQSHLRAVLQQYGQEDQGSTIALHSLLNGSETLLERLEQPNGNTEIEEDFNTASIRVQHRDMYVLPFDAAMEDTVLDDDVSSNNSDEEFEIDSFHSEDNSSFSSNIDSITMDESISEVDMIDNNSSLSGKAINISLRPQTRSVSIRNQNL